jgi:hypothetical protein
MENMIHHMENLQIQIDEESTCTLFGISAELNSLRLDRIAIIEEPKPMFVVPNTTKTPAFNLLCRIAKTCAGSNDPALRAVFDSVANGIYIGLNTEERENMYDGQLQMAEGACPLLSGDVTIGSALYQVVRRVNSLINVIGPELGIHIPLVKTHA